MHHSKLPVLSLLLLLGYLCACNNKIKDSAGQQIPNLIIKGTITNHSNKLLLLQNVVNEKLQTIDSAVSDKDGNFVISLPKADPDFYVLRLNDSLAQLLLLDSTNVELKANKNDFHKSLKINGSAATSAYLDFNKKMQPYLEFENQVKAPLSRLLGKKNLDSIAVVKKKLDEAQVVSKAFIKNYIDSILPSLAIFNMIGYLNGEGDLEYLFGLAKRLKKTMPESKYTKLFDSEITKTLAATADGAAQELTVGSVAPDFSLPDPEGKLISLSSFKGKVLLLDFWASWCGPCRAENPNVVRVFEKYKNKDFHILSVSLDKEKQAWLNAIKNDQLTWTHVSDLQFWNSPVVPLYSIQGIPATFLLDKEGKIIAKNLRGSELELKLQQVFQ